MSDHPFPVRIRLPDDEFVWVLAGGWVEWQIPGFHEVRVRLAGDGSRLVIHELVVRSVDEELPKGVAPTPITASDLRRLQLGRIEVLANQPDAARFVWLSLDTPETDEPTAPQVAARDAAADLLELVNGGSLELVIPPRRTRTDDFYRDVARLFERARQTSRKPAADIAAANGVPVSTVHGWLRDAKKRGVMAPAREARTRP